MRLSWSRLASASASALGGTTQRHATAVFPCAAQLLSGSELSSRLQDSMAAEVHTLRQAGVVPRLAILQVGNREDSNVYIRAKMKAAERLGIEVAHLTLDRSTTQKSLLQRIDSLNKDDHVHGLILQLPLDSASPINSHLATERISWLKDVDGMTSRNLGLLSAGNLSSGFISCTPNGCLELIRMSGVDIKGSKAVVIGRSKIVGTPMSELLKWHDATVTVCHSRTPAHVLESEVGAADIVVAAVGVPNMVPGRWLKPGAVVIDCGITAVRDEAKKSGQRLVGDVDFASASEVAGFLTPVPGGVGPMTVSMLMRNTIVAASRTKPKNN